MRTIPRACLSFDLDTAADHLQGYGHGESTPSKDDPVYARALPRILESLASHQLRATFFVIARDAEAQARHLREIVQRGHEVASHSFQHQLPFSARPASEIELELRRSKETLEEVIGKKVVGFRAPGWDLDPATLDIVRRVGFQYDASIFPGPFLPLLRFATWWKGARRREHLRMTTWRWLAAPRRFHIRSVGGSNIVEFPLTLAPISGFPLYRTMAAYIGDARLARLVRWSRRFGRELSFPAHGVDFLDVDEDELDPRLRVHPGLGEALAARSARWELWLEEIRDLYRFAPFAELARELRSKSEVTREDSTRSPSD